MSYNLPPVGHLETALFDEQAFTNNMTLSLDFEVSSQYPLGTMADAPCQELYRNVTMAQTWQAKKDGE